MKRPYFFRLAVFTGSLISFVITAWAVKSFSQPTTTMIMTTHNPSIQRVKLLARDESQNRKTGQPPQGYDRAIGFADLFLELSNTKNSAVTLRIKRIDIEDEQSGTVQLTTSTAQEIILQPLEQREYDIHLTSQIGYTTQGNVKAVVSYQVGNRLETVDSEVVEVQRY